MPEKTIEFTCQEVVAKKRWNSYKSGNCAGKSVRQFRILRRIELKERLLTVFSLNGEQQG